MFEFDSKRDEHPGTILADDHDRDDISDADDVSENDLLTDATLAADADDPETANDPINDAAVTAPSTPAEPVWLDHLADRWSGHDRLDLSLRHHTGVILNQQLGEPTTRQRKGAFKVKEIAARLRLSVGEILRMRRFAHSFPELEQFRSEHPHTTTWTALKDLLPTLPGAQKRARAGRNPVKDSVKSIESLTGKLKRLGDFPSSEDKRHIRTALKSLGQALPSSYGLVLEIQTAGEGKRRAAKPRSA
jgi:hypothetical protein